MDTDSKTRLVTGCVIAFIGLWLPFVYFVRSITPEWMYSGWSVLINFNNADRRQATNLFHLLPFLLIGLSYIVAIILVSRSRTPRHNIAQVGFLVVSAALLQLVLVGIAASSVYSPGVFDLNYWNELTLGLGTYVSIIGIALSVVGLVGWLMDGYHLQPVSNGREELRPPANQS